MCKLIKYYGSRQSIHPYLKMHREDRGEYHASSFEGVQRRTGKVYQRTE